jgi:hypothetical protein
MNPAGVLLGNTVWNLCWLSGCTLTTNYSSQGARISPDMFSWMMVFRNQAP